MRSRWSFPRWASAISRDRLGCKARAAVVRRHTDPLQVHKVAQLRVGRPCRIQCNARRRDLLPPATVEHEFRKHKSSPQADRHARPTCDGSKFFFRWERSPHWGYQRWRRPPRAQRMSLPRDARDDSRASRGAVLADARAGMVDRILFLVWLAISWSGV